MIKSNKNFVIVIPGRLESSRLPNKLLLEIGEKSIITRVLERCLLSVNKDRIVFCTDEKRLSIESDKLNIHSIITKKECKSGTERIASISQKLVNIANNTKNNNSILQEEILKNTLIINVQGDQPFLDPSLIKEMINFCFSKKTLPLLTTPIYKLKPENIHNPNIVKTLINKNKHAIYFSRSALPHIRGVDKKDWYKYHTYYGHVGIYAYRADLLNNWSKLGNSHLEDREKLEQLKFIDSGYYYNTFLTNDNQLSIDTENQFLEAINYYKNSTKFL